MSWAIKEIHNISRPGETPRQGDIVEIECVGGYVMAVDPVTRTTSDVRKQFQIGHIDQLTPLPSTT